MSVVRALAIVAIGFGSMVVHAAPAPKGMPARRTEPASGAERYSMRGGSFAPMSRRRRDESDADQQPASPHYQQPKFMSHSEAPVAREEASTTSPILTETLIASQVSAPTTNDLSARAAWWWWWWRWGGGGSKATSPFSSPAGSPPRISPRISAVLPACGVSPDLTRTPPTYAHVQRYAVEGLPAVVKESRRRTLLSLLGQMSIQVRARLVRG